MQPGSWVRLLRGSAENAAYLRKHGHGEPWKYRYRIAPGGVREHAVKLEVPRDGSVPRVSEWQLIRRVHAVPEGEHHPEGDQPVVDDLGVRLPTPMSDAYESGRGDGDADLQNDDNTYEIEKIFRAERAENNRYRIYVKWKGFSEVTWRWRHLLVKEIGDPGILHQIHLAVQRCREEANIHPFEVDDPEERDDQAEADRAADFDAEDATHEAPPASASADDVPPAPAAAEPPASSTAPPAAASPLGRGHTRRRQREHFSPAFLLEQPSDRGAVLTTRVMTESDLVSIRRAAEQRLRADIFACEVLSPCVIGANDRWYD